MLLLLSVRHGAAFRPKLARGVTSLAGVMVTSLSWGLHPLCRLHLSLIRIALLYEPLAKFIERGEF